MKEYVWISECIFDHNGWNDTASGANPTIFNHNIDIQYDCSNVFLKENSVEFDIASKTCKDLVWSANNMVNDLTECEPRQYAKKPIHKISNLDQDRCSVHVNFDLRNSGVRPGLLFFLSVHQK